MNVILLILVIRYIINFTFEYSVFRSYQYLCSKYTDGIMIISVIVYMLTNYLGMPLIYLTADCFFDESEGVYVNFKLEIL